LASPDAIVNSAALTDVDLCEEQPDTARRVNTTSVSYLAKSAKAHRAFLVQVSTDYVFSGEKGLYSETDPPSPVNEYGRSKLEGEKMARLAGEGNWSVVRASVVYGWGRPQRGNAATYVYDKLSRGAQIRMVRDQYCSPTYNDNLAKMILEIVERKVEGVLHTAGSTRINRYNFAVLLANTLGLNASLISPVESTDLQWKAKRPRDSSLDVERSSDLLREKPVSAIEGLKGFLKETRDRTDQVLKGVS
jgi:dTDP-4-dehydrorhamnose reductase